MPLPLIGLVVLLVVAAGTAAFAIVRDREHRSLLERAGGSSETSPLLLKNAEQSLGSRLAAWLLERAPESWRSKKDRADKLVHAGYDHPAAPVIFMVVRLAGLVGIPGIVLLFVPRHNAIV